MKKLTFATIVTGMMLIASSAFAQAGNTAGGQLTVTAKVNSSISLVFRQNGAGATLSGVGGSAATLDFGNVSAFGSAPANVTETTGTTSFTLSTPVDIVVTAANSSSANYKLTAQLQAAPTSGETFTVATVPVTSGTAATINATAAYGTISPTIALTIPFTVAGGTTLSDVINFTATSN